MGNREAPKIALRPGVGWKRVTGAVYTRADGLKLHLLGFCKLPGASNVHGDSAEAYYLQNKLIKINGGSRKRGLMAWAATVANTTTLRSE